MVRPILELAAATVAAGIAYRLARDGRPVALARLGGDDRAEFDAATFAALDGITAPDTPVEAGAIAAMSGDVVVEAPPGSVDALVTQLKARVLAVGSASSAGLSVPDGSLAGIVVTRVPLADVATVSRRANVVAVLAEDSVLAAPSIADIADTLSARWLVRPEELSAVDRVMIGTVASDAAGPYFGNRQRTCVVTRFDKTDIQLAALNTDVQCMVLTGGGEPSPYLLDRVAGHRPDVALLLTSGTTVEAVHEIEPPVRRLSRFDGEAKLLRAVELLDAAGATIEF